MDQLMDILTEVNADVDFETCDTLIDDGILDSFDIVSIVGELNDTCHQLLIQRLTRARTTV